MSAGEDVDVIVAGAGVAGLAAARALGEAGRSVLVLEGRDRVGGRLLTVQAAGELTPIELGAEFIHGRPPELLALLDEAKLSYYETGGTHWRYAEGALREAGEADWAAFSLLDALPQPPPPPESVGAAPDAGKPHGRSPETHHDLTFDEFLAQRRPPQADARRLRQYVEGFNAADARRIGTFGLARQQAAEDAIEGDRSARLSRGYGGLAESMRERAEAAGARILLNTPVEAIDWQRRQVNVTAAGAQHRARCAVIALPLGLLQAGVLAWRPEPAQTFAAAKLLAAGSVQRVVLRFRTQFWAERTPGMRFLFTEGELPSTWWTTSPHHSPLLVGWVGGPRALEVASAEALVHSGLRSLERIYALAESSLDGELIDWHLHDWQSDPWARGAYSYALKGGSRAPDAMAEPVEDTLYFAGEHTDVTGHLGTVHGALRSGLRAARQVLGS